MKVAALVLALCSVARATPIPGDELAKEPPATPLETGQPAPFDGVLLSEKRLAFYLDADLRVTEAQARANALEKAIATLEADLAHERQRQISATWWSRNSVWLGLAAGVGASVAVYVWSR